MVAISEASSTGVADIEWIRVVPIGIIFADLKSVQRTLTSDKAIEQHHRKLGVIGDLARC